MANLSKAQIKEKLAKVLKSKDECISIFGLQTKFGGGKTTGFALVYDSADAKKKYDMKTLRKRVSKMNNRTRFTPWQCRRPHFLCAFVSCLQYI